MTAIADRYRRNAQAFAERIAAVPADRWSSPSPCEGWDARDVVRHVVDTHGLFLGFVGRELGDVPSVDEDPAAAFDAARAILQRELDDPESASAGFDGLLGPTTLEASVDRFLSGDLPVHGWDLARATGTDETIDPAEVARLNEEWRQLGPALRSPNVCGPEVTPAPDADDQTRLLNFLGRRV